MATVGHMWKRCSIYCTDVFEHPQLSTINRLASSGYALRSPCVSLESPRGRCHLYPRWLERVLLRKHQLAPVVAACASENGYTLHAHAQPYTPFVRAHLHTASLPGRLPHNATLKYLNEEEWLSRTGPGPSLTAQSPASTY